MRDGYYRSLCEVESEYDAAINAMKLVNPACQSAADPEEWACNALHSCIRALLFGDCGSVCSTGGFTCTLINQRGRSTVDKVRVTLDPNLVLIQLLKMIR